MAAKKAITKTLAFVVIAIGLAHAIALYLGVSAITTTLYLYLFSAAILFYSLKAIGRYFSQLPVQNILLGVYTVLTCLFIGELALRFVPKSNLTYNETINGYYSSEYKRNQIRNIIRKYFKRENVTWYYTNSAHKKRTATQSEFTYTYVSNSLGLPFIESDINNQKPLILTIGDSFTEGIGAPQDSSWPAILEHVLQSNVATNEYMVLNAGKAGSDICYEYVLLQKLLQNYKPKAVILALNTTDIDDIIIRGGMERFKPDSTVAIKNPPWWEPIYATSFIARSIINITAKPDWTLIPKYEKPQAENKAISTIVSTLEHFKGLAQAQHFNLIVTANPQQYELLRNNTNYERLVSCIQLTGSTYLIDLKAEYLKGNTITPVNYTQYYWAQDKHHNSSGYKIWAEIVASHLQEISK